MASHILINRDDITKIGDRIPEIVIWDEKGEEKLTSFEIDMETYEEISKYPDPQKWFNNALRWKHTEEKIEKRKSEIGNIDNTTPDEREEMVQLYEEMLRIIDEAKEIMASRKK